MPQDEKDPTFLPRAAEGSKGSTDDSSGNPGGAEAPTVLDSDASFNTSETATAPLREDVHALKVVGLGASAGGIQALRTFFENTPVDTGMAFVVILHLSPEHESYLAEVLAQATTMPVQQVLEAVAVEPDQVYVIPPGKNLTLREGMLHLSEPEQPQFRKGQRVAIDLFFRSLAQGIGPQAVAVVLSGTGADGSLGLRQVKESGGLVIAQEPGEAEHSGMPRNAIATGMVDYILPVADMARQIIAYWHTSYQMRLPEEAAPSPEQRDQSHKSEAALREIITLVRDHTGHDFGQYKRATVLRRIGRRLQVNERNDLPAYLDYVRRRPTEIAGLVKDLLISVTQFFRDPEAWEALEREVIPLLFENKGPEDTVRAWVCGCATGEEAYSLAILLAEYAARTPNAPRIQVFATDMNDDVIAFAREGSYINTILVDVTPERLSRWFIEQQGRYRISPEIREIVLFAVHDVLKDTPFSRLDLITCRNLLIYLNREAQQQVLATFHFGLHALGYLFLGPSEAVEDNETVMFQPFDKRLRFFSRLSFARPVLPPLRPTGSAASARSALMSGALPLFGPDALPLAEPTAAAGTPPPLSPQSPLESLLSRPGGGPGGTFPSGLHLTLLELVAPPSVLVNERHEIIHISPTAGRFMQIAGGEPTTNLLRLVHPDLRLELRAALITAAQGGIERMVHPLRITLPDEAQPRQIRLQVKAVQEPERTRSYFLVLFEEQAEQAEQAEQLASPLLEEEISRLQSLLQTAMDQHETSVEELRSSNQELQAINEELRSATEELQTGREELQSVNEELETTNLELKRRVDEVSRVNTDLQNLLSATDIGTVFLDREQRIQRFTPAAAALFNFIPTDIGRPLAHVTNNLDYPNLSDDADQVLRVLASIEREVRSADGRWFLARLLPYRTEEDRISGVVATFIDISERKEAELLTQNSLEALRQSEERFRLLVEGAHDYAMFLTDPEGSITFWSAGAERIFGWSEQEVMGQSAALTFTPEDRAAGAPEAEMSSAFAEGRAEDRRWHLRRNGERFWADGLLMSVDDGTNLHGFAKIARDATAQKRAEEALVASEETLKRTNEELEERVQERTAQLAGINEVRRNLLRQLVTAQEEERRRISRELHDQMGQLLSAFLLRLKALEDTYPPASNAASLLEDIRRNAEEMGREVHRIAVELRPTALDDLGLIPALRTHIEVWSELTGISAQFENVNLEERRRLLPAIETTIYRVVQEALTNVARHTRDILTGVSVTLQSYDSHVVAIIEDDGPGFDMEVASKSGRIGLGGMYERATLVDGRLEIESAPGKGTAVYLRVPLPAEENLH